MIPLSKNFETQERLSSLEFCVGDILKIIRSVDQNKYHDHNEISMHMMQLSEAATQRCS